MGNEIELLFAFVYNCLGLGISTHVHGIEVVMHGHSSADFETSSQNIDQQTCTKQSPTIRKYVSKNCMTFNMHRYFYNRLHSLRLCMELHL